MRPPAKFGIDELPPEILAGIGRIVAWWGYLQFQLGVIIREATKLRKETGRVLTVGPEIGVLCNIIRTITFSDYWIKDDAIRSDLQKLGEDVRKKSDNRNDYAHGVFGYKGDNPKVFVRHLMRLPSHRIVPDEEPITPESLKKFSDEARALWVRAQEITHKLKALKQKH